MCCRGNTIPHGGPPTPDQPGAGQEPVQVLLLLPEQEARPTLCLSAVQVKLWCGLVPFTGRWRSETPMVLPALETHSTAPENRVYDLDPDCLPGQQEPHVSLMLGSATLSMPLLCLEHRGPSSHRYVCGPATHCVSPRLPEPDTAPNS